MPRSGDDTLRATARRSGPYTAKIDPSASGGVTIPLDFGGLSFEVAHATAGAFDAALANIVKPLGPTGMLRVGGASSDGAVYPTNAQLEALADFVGAMGPGWSLTYGLNFLKNEPAAAAAQAKVLADRLGSARLIFHVGNEPDLYNGGAGIAWDDFKARFLSYRSTILAQVPGARFGGPDAASTAARANEFCHRFALELGDKAVMLSRHLYGRGVTRAQLSDIQEIWDSRAAYSTAKLIARYAADAGLKARLTEGGSINGSGNFAVASTLGAALWNLETALVLAQAGWGGINWHAGPNNNPAIPELNGYSPILKQADGTYFALPSLYAMLAFQALLGGRFVPVTGKLPRETPAWGVLGADGKTRVVVLNKDFTRTAQINLSSTGALQGGTFRLLTGSDALTTRASYGGATVAADGTFAPVGGAISLVNGLLPILVPPSSAAVVELS